MHRLAPRPLFVFALFLSAGMAQLGVAQLPPVPAPPENPTTPEKAVLGKILFWDEQLSSDNSTACGTCHIPSVGGGDPRVDSALNVHPGPDQVFGTADDIRGSRGVVRSDPQGSYIDDGSFFPNPQVTGRKAPPSIGAQWAPELFWDGRAGGAFEDPDTSVVIIPAGAALESQAVGPMVSDVEMACEMRSHADVAAKIANAIPLRLASNYPPDVAAALASSPTYPALFAAAFGDPTVTAARMGMAIAAYERTLIPDQTPFDAFTQGTTTALTPQQQLGLTVFNTTGACVLCHSGPNFSDETFSNIGVSPVATDSGRFAVTSNPADLGKFKVPSLRNAGLRQRFFHDGSKGNIANVINFYKLGGDHHVNQDIRIQPLTITHTEETALADFIINGLTDPRVAQELPPFDRPTLYSEIAFNAILGAGESGSGGHVLSTFAPQPPLIGAPTFSFGVAKGVGGAPAMAAISLATAPPGTILSGHPVYVDLGSALFVPMTFGGPVGVPGKGSFSFRWAIPDDPNLFEASVAVQFVAVDAAGNGSLVVSDAVVLTLF
ncbi:MAG TPA: cytochrome c peroxidase [Planctomycetota bacterium]|nr:cytochrome c peroxidase [Planctomycetota bacterium]